MKSWIAYFFHSFHSWKKTANQLSSTSKIQCRKKVFIFMQQKRNNGNGEVNYIFLRFIYAQSRCNLSTKHDKNVCNIFSKWDFCFLLKQRGGNLVFFKILKKYQNENFQHYLRSLRNYFTASPVDDSFSSQQ